MGPPRELNATDNKIVGKEIVSTPQQLLLDPQLTNGELGWHASCRIGASSAGDWSSARVARFPRTDSAV